MEAISAIVLLFLGIIPGAYLFIQYNAFVALRNHLREAWSNIDTELRRRYDLIPRLVEVARAYAAHERGVFERVAELRDRCAAKFQAPAEAELVSSLQTLLARLENYPELKADAQFQNLHRELVNTEDRLQAARRFYNGNVRDYRNKYESFPSSAIAQIFGFQPITFFEIEPAVREAPSISLDQ